MRNIGITSFVDSFNTCMFADAPDLVPNDTIPISDIAERATCLAFLSNACSDRQSGQLGPDRPEILAILFFAPRN